LLDKRSAAVEPESVDRMPSVVDRRSLLAIASVLGLCAFRPTRRAYARPALAADSLADVPLEVGGDWGRSLPGSARLVMLRMRAVCLYGVRLLSDRQPGRLRVDNHTSGLPHIWLHDDQPTTAWIVVDIGERDWCKLAYQFGHELGHVLCNSWMRSASPSPPSQWLEEAMVEAFSIRGLGLLAASWEKAPPFAGDNAFAVSIRQYRQDLVTKYTSPDRDMAAWFRANRAALETGQRGTEGVAVLNILPLLEGEPGCVEDLGAVNRWPERTHVGAEDYLTKWQKSCAEIGASGKLPARLRERLGLA
jgi:hypothetical protein